MSDQAFVFVHMKECVQPSPLVGCRTADRSLRALTGANCFGLDRVDRQTRLLLHDGIIISAEDRVLWALFQKPNPHLQVLSNLVNRPIAPAQANSFAHTMAVMACVQPTLLVGCGAVGRSPRELTGTNCSYLAIWFRVLEFGRLHDSKYGSDNRVDRSCACRKLRYRWIALAIHCGRQWISKSTSHNVNATHKMRTMKLKRPNPRCTTVTVRDNIYPCTR